MRKRTGALLLSLLCAGFFIAMHSRKEPKPAYDEQALVARIKELHGRIYSAFNFKEEKEIHAWLAGSFSGAELDEQFYQFLKAIRDFEKQGYQNHVLNIDYKSIRVEKRTAEALRVHMKWSVYGLVKHRLHEHNRLNTYEAVYQFGPPASLTGLRILASEIINGERIIYPRKWYNQAPEAGESREPIIESVSSPL